MIISKKQEIEDNIKPFNIDCSTFDRLSVKEAADNCISCSSTELNDCIKSIDSKLTSKTPNIRLEDIILDYNHVPVCCACLGPST